MEKSVIGAPGLMPVSAIMNTTTPLGRANLAIKNIQALIATGKFAPASIATLQSKLATAKSLAMQLTPNPGQALKSVIGDSTDDSSDDSSDTLDDIESAVLTAATVYQTVTNKPAPVVAVTKLPPVTAPPMVIFGLPAPVVVLGGLVVGGLLLWAITD
jgi:hypothetical protein